MFPPRFPCVTCSETLTTAPQDLPAVGNAGPRALVSDPHGSGRLAVTDEQTLPIPTLGKRPVNRFILKEGMRSKVISCLWIPHEGRGRGAPEQKPGSFTVSQTQKQKCDLLLP